MAKRQTTSRAKSPAKKSAGEKPVAQKRARTRSPSQRRPAAGETGEQAEALAADHKAPSPAAASACEKNKGGRPTECTPEVLEEILDRIANGEYLEDICKDDHMPDRRTVQRHKRRDDKFRRAYACAREDQMESFEYCAMTVAKDGSGDWKEVENEDGTTRRVVDYEHINRSKLIVEQYRWTMMKLAPTIYGERLALDVNDVTPLETTLNKAKQRAREQGFIVVESEGGDGKAETTH